MLEAKAKDRGHRRKCSPKKKVFKIFFQAISNSLAYPEFLFGVSPALKLQGGRVPPSRFSVPSTRFEHWMIRRKRPNSSPNFGKKTLLFPGKTIFFWCSPNFGEKTLQFQAKNFFFWCLFNFGNGIT